MVPKFYEFFEVMLCVLRDGDIHSAKEVINEVATELNLSEDDIREMLPSGKQATYINRIMWARTYLNKVGLIETPTRGHYRITDEGLKALESGEKIDLNYLKKYEAFLVDGEALTRLMIKHDIGVSVEQTYIVRKLDRDYFEDKI